MRVVFMGTPEFSVPTLTEIVSSGHEVVAVYTRAPKPAGRGQAERKSPVVAPIAKAVMNIIARLPAAILPALYCPWLANKPLHDRLKFDRLDDFSVPERYNGCA